MIDKLQMFITLAQTRHFGRAAEALGITQPSLSSGIRQLEAQLGVQLVHRGHRFQGLTPEGNHVLSRALQIVGDVRTLRQEMQAVKTGLSGHLRIGVIPTALPMIARVTQKFLERHPNVTLAILSRTSDEILAGMENLSLDAGVTYLDNEPLGRLQHVPIYREDYRLICAPSSDYAHRKSLTWAEAAQAPLCLLTGDMQNRRIINHLLAPAAQPARARIESNSTIALVSHVLTGQWVSIVPLALAEMFTRSAALRAIPLAGDYIPHSVGLVLPKREPQPPILAALFDYAQREFPTD